MTESQIVRVALGARAYDIHIGEGLIDRAGALIAPLAPAARVFVVTDAHVAAHHLARLAAGLADASLATHTIVLAPGEQQKSFAGLEFVTGQLIRAGLDRRDLVIAFGGGVIGDLAGFAAGIVKRGVDFVQVPTTLLAQVDSSVGGKTAIDTPEGKNLVGLFHQPRLVLADLDVLATLPERELRAGYAEVVKYGLIDDQAFFEWCEANYARVLACEPDALAYAVRHCAAAKARIVAEDERESGARALLNLGHTFGHALESMAGFDGALLHGEAVGAGMALAYGFSAAQGLCPRQDSERVRAHLKAAGFATDMRRLPGAPFSAEALLAAMAHDKKTEAGALTLILAHGLGRAFVQKRAPADDVRAFLAAELAS
jgi:3-dehydroquinate synthase